MYGIGSVGSTMTRMLLERGATIVGAVAASQEKNGKDVGELVGLDTQFGARVYTDPDEALTLQLSTSSRSGGCGYGPATSCTAPWSRVHWVRPASR
jgi:hypothetical protein